MAVFNGIQLCLVHYGTYDMELTNEILDHMEAALKAYKTPANTKLTDQAMEVLGALEMGLSCMYNHDHVAQSDECEWHD
jgi:hypothetical protein